MTIDENHTTKLSDSQSVLLSAASQRQDRTVAPSETLSSRAFARALHGLVKKGFVAELAPDPEQSDFDDRDGVQPSFVITSTGLGAIGAAKTDETSDEVELDRETAQSEELAQVVDDDGPKATTKRALVIAMLSREHGATLNDLVSATGWLPHTTRAALTGLRQKGFRIERNPGEGRSSVYTIAADAD